MSPPGGSRIARATVGRRSGGDARRKEAEVKPAPGAVPKGRQKPSAKEQAEQKSTATPSSYTSPSARSYGGSSSGTRTALGTGYGSSFRSRYDPSVTSSSAARTPSAARNRSQSRDRFGGGLSSEPSRTAGADSTRVSRGETDPGGASDRFGSRLAASSGSGYQSRFGSRHDLAREEAKPNAAAGRGGDGGDAGNASRPGRAGGGAGTEGSERWSRLGVTRNPPPALAARAAYLKAIGREPEREPYQKKASDGPQRAAPAAAGSDASRPSRPTSLLTGVSAAGTRSAAASQVRPPVTPQVRSPLSPQGRSPTSPQARPAVAPQMRASVAPQVTSPISRAASRPVGSVLPPPSAPTKPPPAAPARRSSSSSSVSSSEESSSEESEESPKPAAAAEPAAAPEAAGQPAQRPLRFLTSGYSPGYAKMAAKTNVSLPPPADFDFESHKKYLVREKPTAVYAMSPETAADLERARTKREEATDVDATRTAAAEPKQQVYVSTIQAASSQGKIPKSPLEGLDRLLVTAPKPYQQPARVGGGAGSRPASPTDARRASVPSSPLPPRPRNKQFRKSAMNMCGDGGEAAATAVGQRSSARGARAVSRSSSGGSRRGSEQSDGEPAELLSVRSGGSRHALSRESSRRSVARASSSSSSSESDTALTSSTSVNRRLRKKRSSNDVRRSKEDLGRPARGTGSDSRPQVSAEAPVDRRASPLSSRDGPSSGRSSQAEEGSFWTFEASPAERRTAPLYPIRSSSVWWDVDENKFNESAPQHAEPPQDEPELEARFQAFPVRRNLSEPRAWWEDAIEEQPKSPPPRVVSPVRFRTAREMLGLYDEDDDEDTSTDSPPVGERAAGSSAAAPGPSTSVSSSTETESSSSESGSSVHQEVGSEESSDEAAAGDGAAGSDPRLRFSPSMPCQRDSGYGTGERGSPDRVSFIGQCQDIDALLRGEARPDSFEEFERTLAGSEAVEEPSSAGGPAHSEEERLAAKRNLSLFIVA
ncbi:treacle protein-like [Pollicipes pollicipes]|uniref:treacle protein-like n=1 Tax=Pollicipes pollicipes TaxID=41117 RepID=UPI0018853AB1|nr:treacle protein-like [Pollicipes pollicipes]